MSFTERDEREFREAAGLHQAGNLPAAIRAYEKLLKRIPKNEIILNLHGLAQFQAGNFEAAASSLAKAAAINPTIPDIHYNLATVLQRLGRFDEALPNFERALASRPDDADARTNFGVVLKSLGRLDDAVREFERALALNPNHPGAHLNLGNTLAAQGREADAIPHFEKSIALFPRHPDAYVSLGNAQLALKRTLEALTSFDKALALNPCAAETYACKGLALTALKRYEEAAAHFQRATQIKPDFAEAFAELGNALQRTGRMDEAVSSYQHAIHLKPDFAEALHNLGSCLAMLDRHDESFAPLQKAVELKPGFAKAMSALAGYHFQKQNYNEAAALLERSRVIDPTLPLTHLVSANLNAALDRDEAARADLEIVLASEEASELESSWTLGYLFLSLGEWKRGWELYENRFSRVHKPPVYRHYSAPRWGGEKVRGRLVAWGEQGLGDHILYASMVPDLRKFSDSLVVECSERLMPLFARSFPDVNIAAVEAPLLEGEIAAHVPLASAGKFLRIREQDFPKLERGYLRADESRSLKLRGDITADSKFAIGLSWRSTNPVIGGMKSASLLDFESVFTIPDCRFVDLQYGDTSKDREEVKSKLDVEVSPHPGIDNMNDIDGLAALITACDAVVTTSNTTAHLAGALGKPTWVLLPFGYGYIWYWLKRRADTVWYPEVTLVRQQHNEPWKSVVRRAVGDINRRLGMDAG